MASDDAYIVWTDLCVNVSAKRGKPPRPILVSATGYAEPGSIMAIMGPSGKSTLLDALAVLTGDIMLNGQKKATLSYGTAAYVTQEDVLIGTLTVRESIIYSASLRLPDKSTKEVKRAIVDSTILDMGLTSCQNTHVGNFFVRGLSGGQKRRRSIALQILTRPHLLFLDEPTSGLDSDAAYFVVTTLKNLAKTGRTVISVIHQPSSGVFALFDNFALLSKGRTIFFGESASASWFFGASKYPYPPMQNPSDLYLQIINADFDTVNSSFKNLQVDNDVETADSLLLKSRKNTEEVVKNLAAAYQQSEYATATRARISQILSEAEVFPVQANISAQGGLPGETMQVQVFSGKCITLTQRSFLNMTRDPGYYWLRVAMYVMVGLCLGTIFWRVGFQYSSILARTGVILFVAVFLTFMAIGGFPSFVEDMEVFHHERLNGHYGVAAFVVGNTLSSLPFMFLIALSSGTLMYFMVKLHTGFGHYANFILTLCSLDMCGEPDYDWIKRCRTKFPRRHCHWCRNPSNIYAGGGYFRLTKVVPKPVWRYPVSYIAFHTNAIQGLFKNDFLGLMFENFLGVYGKPIGADITGRYVLEQFYGIKTSRGKWGGFGIIIAMIAIYRTLLFVSIKLSEKIGPR